MKPLESIATLSSLVFLLLSIWAQAVGNEWACMRGILYAILMLVWSVRCQRSAP